MHQSNAVCIYEFWTFHVIYHWMTEGDILQFYSVAVWAGWACSAQPVEATNLLMKPRMFHLQKSQVWSWWRFWVSECLIAVAVRYIERKVSKTICIKQMKQHKSWNPYCFIVFMIICYIIYIIYIIYAMYTSFSLKHLTAALFSDICWIYLALHIYSTSPCLSPREYISSPCGLWIVC